MKWQINDSEGHYLFNLKYLLYVGIIYAVGFSACAALLPLGNYVVCCVITIMHLAIGIPAFIKFAKQYYNDNKESLSKVDDNASREELDTLLQKIDAKQQSFNNKRTIQALVLLLWEVQVVAWAVNIFNCFFKDADISSISIIITILFGSIFCAYLGEISGNRTLQPYPKITCVWTIVLADIGISQLFWLAALSFVVAFIFPSIVILYKQSHSASADNLSQPTH